MILRYSTTVLRHGLRQTNQLLGIGLAAMDE